MELEATITERRRQTRSNIYRHIHTATDFCSKQSLSNALSLSLPTVYQNLTELMEAGLVRYSGEQRSTGGRKAMGLEIVPDARYAVGISITENRLRFVAADLNLKELAYKKVYHEPVSEKSGFRAFLAEELERFLDENQLDREKLLGVGIALPAVFSPVAGNILLAPSLHLRDVTLQTLAGDLPYPTYFENDATSAGYAEWYTYGHQRDMAFLLLETGVGGAVLVNGGQYQGDNRRSGEFGHICVEAGGLPCRCGKSGCLEAYCSARRISDDLGIPLKEFFLGVSNHNSTYELLWDDMLRHLAIGVNSIRMVLDCDVVLGGFLTQYMEPYLPRLQEYAAAYNTFESDAGYLRLSKFRKHAVPLGVALHFVKEFIETI
ncbi:MAG: ROK family protein [Oscillibacter sp.]|jgi:predicted NBD/HSP70 family sugar kinase|nr:ROK family protein [Oscillibacter sp.]